MDKSLDVGFLATSPTACVLSFRLEVEVEVIHLYWLDETINEHDGLKGSKSKKNRLKRRMVMEGAGNWLSV